MIKRLTLIFMCVAVIWFVALELSWFVGGYLYAFFNGGVYFHGWGDVVYAIKISIIISSVVTLFAWVKFIRE